MRNLIILISAFYFLIPLQAFSNGIASWDEIEQLEEKDLPASVRLEASKRRVQAIANKDYPDLLKSWFYLYKSDLLIDRNLTPKYLSLLEGDIKICKDEVVCAIMHAVLANAYQEYAQQYNYRTENQAELIDYIPTKIQNWTSNIFKDTILFHLEQSIEPKIKLQETSTAAYPTLIQMGTDSLYYPSVYDVLARKYIAGNLSDTAKVKLLYNELLTLNEANREVRVRLKLEQLRFEFADNNVLYKAKLRQAIEEEKESDTVVYLWYHLALLEDDAQAHEICMRALSLYPDSFYVKQIMSLKSQLEQSAFSVKVSSAMYPSSIDSFTLTYRRVEQLQVKIYRVLAAPLKYHAYDSIAPEHLELLDTRFYALDDSLDFLEKDTSLTIPFPGSGIYQLVFSAEEIPEVSFKATVLLSPYTLLERVVGDKLEIYVLDSNSGAPVKGVSVLLYDKSGQHRLETLRSNRYGYTEMLMPQRGTYRIYISDGGVIHLPYSKVNVYNAGNAQGAKDIMERRIVLFNDRSIYKPGQKVHFKGIIYGEGRSKSSVVENQTVVVKFLDSERNLVEELKLKTNDFGSFSGNFQIPESGLNGRYYLSAGKTSKAFKVEAYKAPNFKIEFIDLQQRVSQGDTLRLRANLLTYAGYPLPNAEVNYVIKRKFNSYLRYNSCSPEADVILASGKLLANQNGALKLDYVVEENFKVREHCTFYYEVKLSSTDVSGETQEKTERIYTSEQSIHILSDVPAVLLKDSLRTITVQVKDNAGTPIEKQVKYVLLCEGEKVDEGVFTAGASIPFSHALPLISAAYTLSYEVIDNNENVIRHKDEFILYAKDDHKVPIDTVDWFVPLTNACYVGEKASCLIGSNSEVYLLCELFDDRGKLWTKKMKLDAEMKEFSFPYLSSYGKVVDLSVQFLKDGKFYRHTARYTRKIKDRGLHIKIESFRNKLNPGDKELWRLQVLDDNGKSVEAEVLASMYDASLDFYGLLNWSFPYQSLRTSINQFYYWKPELFSKRYNSYLAAHFPATYSFPKLNYYGLNLGRNILPIRYGPNGMYGLRRRKSIAVEEASFLEDQDQSAVPVYMRKDTKETAFFYPHLQADDSGNYILKFEVPSSISQWKMRCFAHTKEMLHILREDTLYTQKSVSIEGNFPQYLRENDKAVLGAKLSNWTEENLRTQVKWEFLEPANDSLIYTYNEIVQLSGKSVVAVDCSLEIDLSKFSLLKCRISVNSTSHKDGEQHLLPILSNKLLITESLPLPMYAIGDYRFDLKNLVKNRQTGIDPRALRLEVSPNLSQFAIDALPYLLEPDESDAISLVASYYATCVAKRLISSHPALRAYLEDSSAYELSGSRLGLNPDLQSILIEETPWLFDAKDGKTVERVALSLQKSVSNIAETRKELWALQNRSGAFSWFNKGEDSPYVTAYVAETLLLMMEDGLYAPDEQESSSIALLWSYYEQQLEASYEKKKALTPSKITHLYLLSFKPDQTIDSISSAQAFYYKEMMSSWTSFSLKEKATIAKILTVYGDSTLADSIATSIKEYAVKDAKEGMFWPNNNSVATHVALMELCYAVQKDEKELNLMKVWLLRQKQLTSWSNVIASAKAVRGLLSLGKDSIAVPSSLSIQFGDQQLSSTTDAWSLAPMELELNLDTDSIVPDLYVYKDTKSLAWGNVYWQYEQDMEDAQHFDIQQTIKLEKKTFLRNMVGGKEVLSSIDQQTVLVPGDRLVVRISLSVDRDVDFIHLKDYFAAALLPVEQTSGMKWTSGTSYYQSPKVSSMHYFFEHLRKGHYVFEYDLWIQSVGEYTQGMAVIESLYTNSIKSHSKGSRITIINKDD